MKVLVTGAGGFTGGYITRRLVDAGYQVRATVRNREAERTVAALGAEPVYADLVDRDSLAQAVRGVEQVYHVAALFRQAGLPTAEFNRVNFEGTRALLNVSTEAKVKRFIHCSTVGVHGHIETPPGNESTPYNPGDPYQESKVAAEKLVLEHLAQGRIGGIVIRPAMIYGPGDTRTLKLFKMVASRKFFYVGAGNSMVHFVDVRDLVEAFFLAGKRGDINGETFIIAGESALPLKSLVDLVADLLGVSKPWLHLPVKPMQALGSLCELVCTPLRIKPPLFRRRVDFFTKDRHFDTRKAREILGFKPAKPLIDELIEIINDYVTNGQIDGSILSKPSAIVRHINGEIRTWDRGAKHTYGWSEQQAVGATSHSLLQTRFPRALDEINEQLNQHGHWRGPLVHQDREGRELKVQSLWRLIEDRRGNPLVLELNRPLNQANRNKTNFYSGSLPLISSTMEQAFSFC